MKFVWGEPGDLYVPCNTTTWHTLAYGVSLGRHFFGFLRTTGKTRQSR